MSNSFKATDEQVIQIKEHYKDYQIENDNQMFLFKAKTNTFNVFIYNNNTVLFQGKDANEVLFVLGCSDKSVGAMNWMVKKANILNVACTRAKYRIAFIGNLNDWKNRRYFREFIPKFIDTIDA